MAERRPLLQSRPVRLPGDAAGEYRVGAYARRQFWRRVWFGVFGIALIIGAGGLYCSLRPEDARAGSRTLATRVRCLSCGFEGDVQVEVNAVQPLACPKCHQHAARPLWKCRACGEMFLPAKSGSPVKCTKCGSENVGAAPVSSP